MHHTEAGGPLQPDETRVMSFGLEFQAEPCPECERPAEAGPCSNCGAIVPDCFAVSDSAAAREATFREAVRQTDLAIERFAGLPAARVAITTDMLVAALDEARLFERTGNIIGLGHELQDFDLNDRATLGGPIRRRMFGFINQLNELIDLCADISAFAPDPPGIEIRDLAIKLGRQAASTVQAYLRVFSALTMSEARTAEQILQSHLAEPPETAALIGLLDDVRDTSRSERVGRAFGRPGIFVDEIGAADPAALARAFAGDPNAWTAIGDSAKERFAEYLGSKEIDATEAAGLALPMMALACVERPLSAERLARGVAGLIEAAAAVNPMAVRQLVNQVSSHGARLVAIHARVRRRLHAVDASLGAAGEIDDLAVEDLLNAYRALCEGPWRELSWGVVRLHRIKVGSPSREAETPMIAALRDHLNAAGVDAMSKLADCLDGELRNTGTHEKGMWDPDAACWVGNNGERYSIPDIAHRIGLLGDALVGADAGWNVGIVAAGIDAEPPSWLANGESQPGNQLLASFVVGLGGATVVDVKDRCRSIRICESASDLDPAVLMPALVGLASFLDPGGTFEIVGGDGIVVVSATSEVLRSASKAAESIRDLACLKPFASWAVATGNEPSAVAIELAASQVFLVVVRAVNQLAEGTPLMTRMPPLARRLDYVAGTLRGTLFPRIPELSRLAKRLTRAAENAARAGRGDARSAIALGDQIQSLLQWSVQNQGDFIQRATSNASG